MNFTVNISKPVIVDTTSGTPRISLNVGGDVRYASYASGTGSSALTFTYTASPGDIDLDGISIAAPSIDLNGGTIIDLSGNALSNLSFTAPVTSGINVDYPSLGMYFTDGSSGRYTLNGTVYTSLSSFLTATGGGFARASIGTYFDSSGTLQTASANVPRFDYDPATLQAKGIIIEESRTNSVRNGQAGGAVAGTPGTLPTNWHEVITPAGLSYEILSTGSSSGIPYIDIRIYGTPTSAYPALYFEPANQIPAATGQGWTVSAFIQRIGAATGVSAVYLRAIERTSGGAIAVTNESAITLPTSGAFSATRASRNFTFSGGASTVYAHPGLRLGVSVGVPVNITLRIGGAQLERGTFASSYIPTTTTEITRSAEGMVVPTTGWFSSTESTLFGYGSTKGINAASTFGDINNNNWNERFQLRIQGGFTYGAIITAANVLQAGLSGGSTTANTMVKMALAAKVNDSVLYAGGVQRNTDNSLTMPSNQTQIRIGGVSNGAEYLNGSLQTIKYYPRRTPNAQLQLLTQ